MADIGHSLVLMGDGGRTIWKKINERNSLFRTPREHNKRRQILIILRIRDGKQFDPYLPLSVETNYYFFH